MNKIDKIIAEEIKDSRGNPTLKVTVYSGDVFDSFSVPSGASTGIHEAHELRDPELEQAQNGAGKTGKGVKNAIEKVNDIIAPALIGKDISNQKEIDQIMIDLDGTKNKDNLGGNSMIGVSIAVAKTASKVKGQEVYEYLRGLQNIKISHTVPFLYMNLINGGKHAQNNLAFQEYHIVPQTDKVKESIEIGITIQNTIKEIILAKYGEESIVLGDEGGFAPKISDIREPLVILSDAINKNNLQNKVRLALDVASSSFYNHSKEGKYKIGERDISKEELMSVYRNLINEFLTFIILFSLILI